MTGTVQIAIDGPSGAGKSTISRAIAARLSFVYLDTGALYRAIGVYFLQNNLDYGSETAVEPELSRMELALFYESGEQRIALNGADVSESIRTPQASMAASAVSALPCVRRFLLDLQRDIARKNNVVMDGRDIGTVVLPDAQVKIFLTASLAVRARRREKELLEKGESVRFDQVLQEMEQRDADDSNRAIAPLRPAQDAILLDTSDLNFEQSVELVIKTIKEKLPHVL
jgi:cytidylate kinase